MTSKLNFFDRIQLGLYRKMVADVEFEHGQLYSFIGPRQPPPFAQWFEVWERTLNHQISLQVSADELIMIGRLLSRVAESHTNFVVATRVARCLESFSARGTLDGLEIAETMVTSGELDRRLGRLDSATSRCMQALALAEAQDTPSAHKLMSRIYYELAYSDLYGGNADSALERLHLSRIEADKSGHAVGAGIARVLIASILIEEGILDTPTETLIAESRRFAALSQSAETKRDGSHVLADRWRVNCDIHAIQSLLACAQVEAARRAYNDFSEHFSNPSQFGHAILAFTGACICLAEGEIDKSASLAERCRKLVSLPFESQESAASIGSLYGIISLARGDAERAHDAFDEAIQLIPAHRNAKGQGWAALGLAILAVEEGDRSAARAVLDVGIARCARCCAPVRRAMVQLHSELAADSAPLVHKWRFVLQALTGPLPRWLTVE